jgi:hypothetical protein
MDLLIDWPLKTALLALLSNEYPIETTLCDEQVTALADKVNGVVTLVLLTGELTVTPARAGTVRARRVKGARVKERSIFISVPLRLAARRKASFGAGSAFPFLTRSGDEYVFPKYSWAGLRAQSETRGSNYSATSDRRWGSPGLPK